MGLFDNQSQGINQLYQNPLFNIGVGLLGRSDQRLGPALGQSLSDYGQNQMVMQQYQQQQDLMRQKLEQQRQQQEAEQKLAQQMGMQGLPQWALQERYKAQNAQPQTTNSMREYEFAKSQGFKGSLLDYVTQTKRAGATAINLNSGVKPEPGKVFVDPKDPMKGMTVIPGSDAEIKRAGAENEIDKAISIANDGVALIDAMLSHPGKQYAIGASSMLPIIPGTPPAGFDAMAKQLEGKAFLQAFESLKGGGTITEVEGRKATDAMARLQRSQSEKDYDAALRELKNIYQRAISRHKSMSRRSSQGQAPGVGGSGWSVEVIE